MHIVGGASFLSCSRRTPLRLFGGSQLAMALKIKPLSAPEAVSSPVTKSQSISSVGVFMCSALSFCNATPEKRPTLAPPMVARVIFIVVLIGGLVVGVGINAPKALFAGVQALVV